MKTLFQDILCVYPQRWLCTKREGWGERMVADILTPPD